MELGFRIPIVSGIPDSLSYSPDSKAQAYSPFTWKNRKLRLENQMVRAIPFWNLQKMWAVTCSDTTFSARFSLFSWFDILRSGLFSLRHVKFYSFMFMHRNSTQVVCVKGRHSRIPDPTRKIGRIPEFTSKNRPDSRIRIPLHVSQHSYMFYSLLACPSSRVVQTVWSDRLSSMSYLVCVRFLPVWLACAWESCSDGHYPSEVASTAFVRLYFCGVYCSWFGRCVILSCV